MNVILNNMIALLSEGAFSNREKIAPMSEFKWRVLLNISKLEDISPYIYRGLNLHSNDKDTNIPATIKEEMGKMAFNNTDEIKVSFDINDIDSLGLSYPVKQYVFKDIVYKERHSIDTSRISLDLLGLIIQNTNLILRYGIRLRGIVELGIFLRSKGQWVDFVKVEAWLQKMKLSKMAALQASILISTFSFEEAEFPYLKKYKKKSKELLCKSLGRVYRANKLERTFNKYNISNCIRYRKFSRTEAFCKAASNIIRSLSEIEE